MGIDNRIELTPRPKVEQNAAGSVLLTLEVLDPACKLLFEEKKALTMPGGDAAGDSTTGGRCRGAGWAAALEAELGLQLFHKRFEDTDAIFEVVYARGCRGVGKGGYEFGNAVANQVRPTRFFGAGCARELFD